MTFDYGACCVLAVRSVRKYSCVSSTCIWAKHIGVSCLLGDPPALAFLRSWVMCLCTYKTRTPAYR